MGYSKYNAVRSNYGGYNYPSRLEAKQAFQLDVMLKAGEILAWERQYKVDFDCIRTDGVETNLGSHKVDFRVHELDGNFTLIETKGVMTADYMLRKRMLDKLWLPTHRDHTYKIVKSL